MERRPTDPPRSANVLASGKTAKNLHEADKLPLQTNRHHRHRDRQELSPSAIRMLPGRKNIAGPASPKSTGSLESYSSGDSDADPRGDEDIETQSAQMPQPKPVRHKKSNPAWTAAVLLSSVRQYMAEVVQSPNAAVVSWRRFRLVALTLAILLFALGTTHAVASAAVFHSCHTKARTASLAQRATQPITSHRCPGGPALFFGRYDTNRNGLARRLQGIKSVVCVSEGLVLRVPKMPCADAACVCLNNNNSAAWLTVCDKTSAPPVRRLAFLVSSAPSPAAPVLLVLAIDDGGGSAASNWTAFPLSCQL